MLPGEGLRREIPKGGQAQESNGPRPDVKNRVASKGNGFPDGMNPLKRRCEALTGFTRKRKSGWGRETFRRSSGRRKALKGKAQSVGG